MKTGIKSEYWKDTSIQSDFNGKFWFSNIVKLLLVYVFKLLTDVNVQKWEMKTVFKSNNLSILEPFKRIVPLVILLRNLEFELCISLSVTYITFCAMYDAKNTKALFVTFIFDNNFATNWVWNVSIECKIYSLIVEKKGSYFFLSLCKNFQSK